MDIERERFETETDLENLLFDKTVNSAKVSVNRYRLNAFRTAGERKSLSCWLTVVMPLWQGCR